MANGGYHVSVMFKIKTLYIVPTTNLKRELDWQSCTLRIGYFLCSFVTSNQVAASMLRMSKRLLHHLCKFQSDLDVQYSTLTDV